MRRLLPLLFLLAFTGPAFAATGMPSLADLGLTPEAAAQVVGPRQLIVVHEPRRLSWTRDDEAFERDVQFVTNLKVFDAPVTKVREIVTDYAKYPAFMPNTEGVELSKKDDGTLHVEFELEFELPVMNAGVEYTLAYTFEDSGNVSWNLVDGDLGENVGRWEFYGLPDGKTLAFYTNWTDLASMSFALRMILDAQPQLRVAIPVASTAVIMDAVRSRLAEGKPSAEETVVKEPTIPLLSSGRKQVPLETWRKLTRQGTVLFIHPSQTFAGKDGPVEMTFVSAGVAPSVPLKQAKTYSTAFDRFPEFFDQVDEAKISRQKKFLVVDWTLKLGFGLFSIPIDYTLAYADDGSNSMPFKRLRGDLEYIYGAWEWFPIGEKETLVLYTTGSHMGNDAPALLKLGELIPNRKLTVGVSTAVMLTENLKPWMEKQAAGK